MHSFPVDSLPEVIYVNPKSFGKSIRHRDMPKNRKQGWWSDAKKMEVACAYAVTGNSRRVSELCKVPEGTIRAWKTTEWWQEIISRVHSEQNEELDTKLTKLIDKAIDNINDRLENGDYQYNARKDKLIRKPVGARDLAAITATTIDKRQLLRGEPTSRVQKVSENEKLVRLAEEFKKFALAKTIESTADKIEEEQYATQEGEISEGNFVEYQDGDGAWEEPEAGSSDSDVESWEESEKEEQETLTVNEMFTE